MNYTDTAGNPATGVVWSPGPLPGTVWVLPRSGASASEARVVSVRKGSEINAETVARRRAVWNFDHSAHESDSERRLPPKDWHAALGYDPCDVVRAAESALPLDLTA